ncbi:MAG: DUF4384 domain-containing protein [Thermoanaerobaculia bacterium]|nr:DUF4384 domain-containing protein [Thermoanaerobaculia bacterium]
MRREGKVAAYTVPMSNKIDGATRPEEPSLRYGMPALLGVVLGVVGLLWLGRLEGRGSDHGASSAAHREAPPSSMPSEELTDGSADGPEPIPCRGAKETIECLRGSLDSTSEVTVFAGRPEDPGSVSGIARVGEPLGWTAVSERAGFVTSFVSEADGGVLLLYPSPTGESPLIDPGKRLGLPANSVRSRLRWNRPGPRRVFVLVSSKPFDAPEGSTVAPLVTYYAPGPAVETLLAALRRRIGSDSASGEGAWAAGEVLLNVSVAD